MAIVGSSPLSMFNFNVLYFSILNPWFHRLHGLFHAIQPSYIHMDTHEHMWFLPCFFCTSPTWGWLRCSQVTLGIANPARGPRCLHMTMEIRDFPDRTPEIPQLERLSLKHAALPNAHCLKEPLTKRGCTVTECQVCWQGRAVWMAALPLKSWRSGRAPFTPPTGTPGPATWEEQVLYSSCWRRSMAQGIQCARNMLFQPGCAGLQDPLGGATQDCSFPLRAGAAGHSGSWLGGGSQWTWATSSSSQC